MLNFALSIGSGWVIEPLSYDQETSIVSFSNGAKEVFAKFDLTSKSFISNVPCDVSSNYLDVLIKLIKW